MATVLPEESFLALACLIHADGRLAKSELDGFRRAARAYAHSEERIAAIEAEAAAGATLDAIVWPDLTAWQKALTYSFAVWVAKADGSVSKDEHQQLQELGDALGLDKLRRDAARSATYDIAALPGGHKPDQYDFGALELQLQGKLPGSFKEHQKA